MIHMHGESMYASLVLPWRYNVVSCCVLSWHQHNTCWQLSPIIILCLVRTYVDTVISESPVYILHTVAVFRVYGNVRASNVYTCDSVWHVRHLRSNTVNMSVIAMCKVQQD